jgi:hypothetical protein
LSTDKVLINLGALTQAASPLHQGRPYDPRRTLW